MTNSAHEAQKKAAPAFPTGRGQSDTHALVLTDGRQNPHPAAGLPYTTITGRAILKMVREPQSIAKDQAQWFIPSTYAEHDARSHESQLEHGEFWWLCADIDKGNRSQDDVLAALRAAVGDVGHLVYSTRSSTSDCRKWRALVPLAHPLAGADYADTQAAFFELLEASGLVLDRSLARPGQLIYLPNRGEFYDPHAEQAAPLELADDHPIVQRREAARAAKAEAERVARVERERKAAQRLAAADDGGASPVDDFNARHSLAELLTRYGYAQAGGSCDWRSPLQSSGSFATRVGGERWVSLSGSDAAAKLGHETATGARAGDAFDLFVHFEHAGDFDAAVRAWAEEAELRSATSGRAKPNGHDHHPHHRADHAGQREGVPSMDARAAETAPDTDDVVDRGVSLEDFYAYMPTHRYIFAPSRELWPAGSVNARVPGIMRGDKYVPASALLDQNRPVEQMTWAPGEPMVIRDRLVTDGGWIPRPDCAVFNLYRPPVLVPRRGDASPWLDHVYRVYPDDAGHLIRWLAQRVQRPDTKVNHALVLGGAQGVGKDTILEPVKRAIGPYNFAEVSPQQMLSRFNGFLKSVIIRVSEARDLGELDRYAFYDHTKTLIAAPPDVLRVDEKNLREYSILNCCGVIITSNHKTDGIYLPADDRRHYVAWSDLAIAVFDGDYWQKLYAWYDGDGAAIVAHYLQGLDLSGFDPKAPPSKTPAFWAIVDANRAPENAELADALDKLGNPDAVTTAQVKTLADADFVTWLNDRRNAKKIAHRFEECGYVLEPNPDAKDRLWRTNGRRQLVYVKAKLCQQARYRAAAAL